MMKRLFLLLVVASACIAEVAAQSVLRVQLADNTRFNMSVNGRHFNRRGTSVTVGDLPSGVHFLKIFKVGYDRWGNYFDRLIYQGTVTTRYGMITNFVYDPFTRRITARNMPQDSYTGYGNNHPDNNQYRGYYKDGSTGNDDQYNQQQSMPDNSSPAQPMVNDDPSPTPGAPAASPLPAGSLSDDDADKLKTKVAAKATDTEKLKFLKDVLSKETVTTFQVSTMMEWFLFESSKLEFAKWAYAITTDKDYYGDLAAKLSYKNSKDDLEQFLNSKK